MPALDLVALEAACREVSQGVLWIPDQPENMDDIVTTREVEELIEGYMHFSTGFAESLELAGDDPNMVVRAVQFMARRVAIPAFGQDVLWFRNVLGVLLHLASPEMFGMPASHYPFHEDLARGLAASKKAKGKRARRPL